MTTALVHCFRFCTYAHKPSDQSPKTPYRTEVGSRQEQPIRKYDNPKIRRWETMPVHLNFNVTCESFRRFAIVSFRFAVFQNESFRSVSHFSRNESSHPTHHFQFHDLILKFSQLPNGMLQRPGCANQGSTGIKRGVLG